ncbi:MAG TPA: CHRD domain-containing protein [Trebonia sp.]|nr:CHRD domain-containing protein [Trebonia sp.]
MTITDRLRKRATVVAVAAGGIAVAGAIASSGLALPASATSAAATAPAAGSATTAYNFRTLDNAKDLTFNQLLGINNKGLIAGYFGSGALNHPNKGYQLTPNGSYTSENFPGSAQTQVTGLNDQGATVGFWSTMNNASQVNDNHGWWSPDGRHFFTADYPTSAPASPPVDQLLGINNHDFAVGFYTDASGNNHGYYYDARDNKFGLITAPASLNSPSLTATAVNTRADIAGVYTDAAGNTDGFIKFFSGGFTTLRFPGATSTQALGVNDSDEVVGFYMDGTGSSATTHGFTWTPTGGFRSVDDPNGIGMTTINGVNNAGDIVGFYTDGAGNVDGFKAAPVTSKVTLRFGLTPMPQGQLVVGAGTVSLSEYGFTPGSSHEVVVKFLGIQIPVGTLTANSGGSASWSFSLSMADAALRQAEAHAGVHPATSNPAIQVAILNAGQGTPVIAETPAITGLGRYPVHGVEPGYGVIKAGNATLVYNPAAGTISVTVNATGLTPGAHAAHIHVGSCQQQGAVAYMLMDFTANSHGVISNETRTVTGVKAVELSGGWYLNLHQGNSNNILNSAGQPTIFFRPLECANI